MVELMIPPTSMDRPMAWIMRSKMVVFSASNDRHFLRHLYMMQAAMGLPLGNPIRCAMHRFTRSWHSCF